MPSCANASPETVDCGLPIRFYRTPLPPWWLWIDFPAATASAYPPDPGREIFDVIRTLGMRKKIFNIHFRNIRGRRDDFQEVYPDEGDMDMLSVMLTLKEVEYPYMVMPDHIPRHPDDPNGRQAFTLWVRLYQGLDSGRARAGLS